MYACLGEFDSIKLFQSAGINGQYIAYSDDNIPALSILVVQTWNFCIELGHYQNCTSIWTKCKWGNLFELYEWDVEIFNLKKDN